MGKWKHLLQYLHQAGYEYEKGHQHNHPDQAASARRGTGGRTRRGARDWSDYTANPKVPSTGEPPEPDLGIIPPGPRKTVGGKPKPSTSAQLRLKPSAQSVREAQEELRRVLAKKREEKRKKAAARVGKEEWPESSKRWSEEALQISAGNCCPEADQAIPKIHGTFDQEAALFSNWCEKLQVTAR